VIGNRWTRINDPEIDLVGTDRQPAAKDITTAVSIKWLEASAFDTHDLARLAIHRSRLPGAGDETPVARREPSRNDRRRRAIARPGRPDGRMVILTP